MALSPEVRCLSVATTLKVRGSGTSGVPVAAAANLRAEGKGGPQTAGRGKLQALRVRRCLSLENRITSLRLAPGQGREKC